MRYTMKRENYVSPQWNKLVDDTAKAEVYTYEDQHDRPYAIGFSGKRNNPDFHHRFVSKAEREKYINKYLDGLRETLAWKAEQRAKKREFTTSLEVGDILYTSWGYDQTNVDWFQVVEVKPSGKTVVIREIAGNVKQTGFMCGQATPCKSKFVGEPLTKRVQRGDQVKIHQSAYAYKWDGKPKYNSWYA